VKRGEGGNALKKREKNRQKIKRKKKNKLGSSTKKGGGGHLKEHDGSLGLNRRKGVR